MASRKKKTVVHHRQKQKQTQNVVINIAQPAPKRKRARKARGGGQPVVYREFQKVIYSDANPIQIYENQNRYKNIDAKPLTRSQVLSQLEDIGQVGTEGRVEILPQLTKKEQQAEFITPVAKADTATQVRVEKADTATQVRVEKATTETQTQFEEPARVRQEPATSQPMEMNLPQGDNKEMKLPANEATRLFDLPENAAMKEYAIGMSDIWGKLQTDLAQANEEGGGEYESPITTKMKIVNPTKKIRTKRPPKTEEQKARDRYTAKIRREKQKAEKAMQGLK